MPSIARATAETAARLPGVPLDVAERALDGAERGIDKLTDPGRKRLVHVEREADLPEAVMRVAQASAHLNGRLVTLAAPVA